jgi:beta-galactosidase
MSKVPFIRIGLLLVVINCLFAIQGVSQDKYWENPELFEENKLAPRATFYHYLDEKSAISDNWQESESYQLLNGIWKFNWVRNPSDRPSDFYKTDFEVTNWSTIEVLATGNYKDLVYLSTLIGVICFL